MASVLYLNIVMVWWRQNIREFNWRLKGHQKVL
jgi:hypothetical protein